VCVLRCTGTGALDAARDGPQALTAFLFDASAVPVPLLKALVEAWGGREGVAGSGAGSGVEGADAEEAADDGLLFFFSKDGDAANVGQAWDEIEEEEEDGDGTADRLDLDELPGNSSGTEESDEDAAGSQ
jgi:hypothetical protein